MLDIDVVKHRGALTIQFKVRRISKFFVLEPLFSHVINAERQIQPNILMTCLTKQIIGW